MSLRRAGAGAFALAAVLGGGAAAVHAAQSDATSAPPRRTATAAGSTLVRIAGFEYRPGRLVVRRGTRVTWVDRDTANHTVTFRGRPGDLGNLNQGQRRSVRFRRAGTYRYYCKYHPNMRAKVIVR